LIEIETRGHNQFLEGLTWIFKLKERKERRKLKKKAHWHPPTPLPWTHTLPMRRGQRSPPNIVVHDWFWSPDSSACANTWFAHVNSFFYNIYFLKLPNNPWVNLKKLRKVQKPPWNHTYIIFIKEKLCLFTILKK